MFNPYKSLFSDIIHKNFMSNNIQNIPPPSATQIQDLDLLKRMKQLSEQIESDGWEVRLSLIWKAEAKRGQDFECATGSTSEDALLQLYHNTKLARQEGCP
jgi:hypothetical protein